MKTVKKINEFVKSHFIQVLTFTALMGALFSAQSQEMKKIVLFNVPHTPWRFDIPTLALFFMMVSTSIHCRIRDFRHLSKVPRSFLTGVAQFYLILPVLGWCGAQLGSLLLGPEIGPQIGAGVALVALMPVAAISNLWVKLVKGNAPLLLVFLTLTTSMNIIVTPILLSAILGMSAGDIHVPRELMVGNLLIGVLLPLSCGMIMREFFEKFVLRYQDIIALFGVLGLHIAFFANSGNAIPILSHMSVRHLCSVIVLTVSLNAVSSLIALFLGKRMKLSYEDRATIAMAGGMRSNGIALVVGMKTFPAYPLVTVPAAIYSFCQHITSGYVKKILDKQQNAAAAVAATPPIAAVEPPQLVAAAVPAPGPIKHAVRGLAPARLFSSAKLRGWATRQAVLKVGKKDKFQPTRIRAGENL